MAYIQPLASEIYGDRLTVIRYWRTNAIVEVVEFLLSGINSYHNFECECRTKTLFSGLLYIINSCYFIHKPIFSAIVGIRKIYLCRSRNAEIEISADQQVCGRIFRFIADYEMISCPSEISIKKTLSGVVRALESMFLNKNMWRNEQ